jgi:DNA-binding LacI/PurR family transcriptional regulator
MSPPLYAEVANALRERIRDGVYPPGARMPGHLRVAKEFGVSPITSNRALKELTDEGLVIRKERRGSFVAAEPFALTRLAILVPRSAGPESVLAQDYIRGCLERAEDHGLTVEVRYELQEGRSFQDWMPESSAHGFIHLGVGDYAVYDAARRLNRPLVVAGETHPPGDHFVSEDRAGCAEDLVRRLIADGAARPAFVGGLSSPDHRLARDGYLAAVADLGIGHRFVRDANELTIGPVIEDLLEPALGVDAVFVMGGRLPFAAYPTLSMRHPEVAIGVLRESREIDELAGRCYIGVFSQADVGREAVDLLCDVKAGKAGPGKRFIRHHILAPGETAPKR